jgi:chaperonin cofactor prefoldin
VDAITLADKTRVMGKESSKLEKDLDGLKKRIQTSRKKLREAEIKARNLQSSIATALLAPDKARRNKR